MGLSVKYMPQPTPLDPAEDPPGSIDPLGTLGPAERIAEVLFPGFTARMWRPRLLTFTAVASIVTERVRASRSEIDDSGLSARLGFERLFVSSVIRQQERDPDEWKFAALRLTGNSLARTALHSGNVPLGRNNFLKGQAINGPFGVMARLARHVGILDEDDCLGRDGEKLLLAWSNDEQLQGFLDENPNESRGRKWLERFSSETAAYLIEGQWRSSGWSGWHELAKPLRPDHMGKQERRIIRHLLDNDRIRARCIELLCGPAAIKTYRAARDDGRGDQDRKVLFDAVLPALSVNERYEDSVIDLTIRLADGYEGVANLLETAFNCLLWVLTRSGGQAKPDEIETDKQILPIFGSICQQLIGASRILRDLIERISTFPQIGDRNPIEPLDTIATQAATGAENPSRLIETVINRHRDIQNFKGKGMWIEPGDRWTLMPGFGLVSEGPPQPQVRYLHTFRVANLYSFLSELGLSSVEVHDGEA